MTKEERRGITYKGGGKGARGESRACEVKAGYRHPVGNSHNHFLKPYKAHDQSIAPTLGV